MYLESPLDGIPTGRSPHQNFVQWWFRSLLPGILTRWNPTARLTSRLFMYFNLDLQRHYEDKLHCVLLFFASYQGNGGDEGFQEKQ